MKKTLYPLFLFLLPFLAPALQAQGVAIVGWDGGELQGGTATPGDEFSFVLLRDFPAGEIIYFTEDEYVETTSSFNSGEGHIAYTVPAGGLLENDVVKISESSVNAYTVSCAAGTAAHVAGSGNWGLVTDGLGGMSDEIYAYSASNAAAPWSSVTEVHCFAWATNINPSVGQFPATDYPNSIYIAWNIGGPSGFNADFKDVNRVNTTLASLQNGANWNKQNNNNPPADIALSCTDFTNQMIASVTLPVELTSFEAKVSGKVVLLDWATATEVNNEKFEVEHSTDGRAFSPIGTVARTGTSGETNFYQLIHDSPEFGINHYRLKQIDYDDSFTYSDVVTEEYHGNNLEATAYPNPFDQSVTVQFPLTENTSFGPSLRAIKIYDAYGKLVHSERVSLDASTVTLKLPNLSNGTYFLHATNGSETLSTLRIVKD